MPSHLGESKSRLPLPPASSPDRTMPLPSRKRKATDEPADLPSSKSQAIVDSTNLTDRPTTLRTSSRSRIGAVAGAPPVRPIKAIPTRPPLASSSSQKTVGRGIRAGSAPPIKTRPVGGILNGKRTAPDANTGRNAGLRVVSSTSSRTLTPVEDEGLVQVKQQLSSMATILDAERGTVADLVAFRSKIEGENRARTMDSETRRGMIAAADELDDLKRRHARQMQDVEEERIRKERELRLINDALGAATDDLARERETIRTLKNALSERANTQLLLESQVSALKAQCSALSSEKDAHATSKSKLILNLDSAAARIAELENEVQDAETLRRKLHNQVQELKGNIRVFCRVRPALPHEKNSPEGLAPLAFPDKQEHKDIVISKSTETAMGATRDSVLPFSFDRVFEPPSSQAEVFEEISHLTQSCIDGYNVCIFAYGQTGSGKSFTMEGGSTEESRGMIPRAVRHVFSVAEQLRKKGWSYSMEGQFLEIYNETIVDLLGNGNETTKHEVKHDKGGRTSVTDVVVYPLRSPDQVQKLLSLAQSRRTVHATLMNERSSRSHSVFTLRIAGSNKATGETCEGSLNLVDLAGSERLKDSGAASHKDRLKETQAINKSLSALGDVIAALGEKAGSSDKHIPYRNSQLTYLLQNSLSGNSKTLMFVNVSPLGAHLNESICSLRFATKVNNTTVGTVKKQPTRVSS
ncbi:kinesin-like nuclear fusion protein [Tulasnella sp. JGI-2019a]|nr:kinesin-like nuclear fusion protein [Tulasnella sp. JGI-2019a]KAG9008637.1 kinesin-like nuclear fusion protein [Tulasnella sp. JGI-2019a]KAG9033828.1 kinesin-like nuclear fusion protein [Tulasnella sp. JGI-2019a]